MSIIDHPYKNADMKFSAHDALALLKYIYYWNIQFLNKVIFIKTKDFPPLGIGSVCSRQKTIKLKILLP
jgi:hypothetical protein